MRGRITGLLVTLALLVGSLAVFEFTDADVRLQDRLYDFTRQRWLVDKNAPLPRLLFYNGPKGVIIALSVVLLVTAALPDRWRPRWLKCPWPKLRVWCVLACLAVVPIVIGIMKARSSIYCPWALERYGGMTPYHHLFEPLPPGVAPGCGNCFPAGHASGGFALMALGLLFNGRRARWLGLATGLICGWTMGIYQMLKGAHFLSHTTATMLLAFLLIQLLAWCFRVKLGAAPPPMSDRGDPAN